MNQIYNRKPFNPSLHEENDPICRDLIKSYLNKNIPSMDFRDNPDIYGIDLQGYYKKQNDIPVMGIELARLNSWQGNIDTYPYPLYTLYDRKKRYFDTINNTSWLIIIRSDLKRMIIAQGKDIYNYINDDNVKIMTMKDGCGGYREEKAYLIPIEIFITKNIIL